MQARCEQFAKALVERLERGAAVLDFGCGSGDITQACAAAGFAMTGCDISPGMIEQANRRFGGEARCRFVLLDPARATVLPFADGTFAAVIASSVFEYIHDPLTQMRELDRVLRPRGWLLLTVPDPRHPVRLEEQQFLHRYSRGPRAWVLRFIPRWSKLRTRLEYLSLSSKRPGVDQWRAWLILAGFEPEPIVACDSPLLMLAARRSTRGP